MLINHSKNSKVYFTKTLFFTVLLSCSVFITYPEAEESINNIKWLQSEKLKKIDWKKSKNISTIYEKWKKYDEVQDIEEKTIIRREVDAVKIGNTVFTVSLNKFKLDGINEIVLYSHSEAQDSACDDIKKELDKIIEIKSKSVELNYFAKSKADFNRFDVISSWEIANTRVLFNCFGSTTSNSGFISMVVQISDKDKIEQVKDPTYLKCEGLTQDFRNGVETKTTPIPPVVFIIDENRKELRRGDSSTLGKIEIFNSQNIISRFEDPKDKNFSAKLTIDRIAGSFNLEVSSILKNKGPRSKTFGSCKKTNSEPAF